MNSYPVDLADPNALTSVILANATYGVSLEEICQLPEKVYSLRASVMMRSGCKLHWQHGAAMNGDIQAPQNHRRSRRQ
jgi:hypothetical protein